MDNPQILSQKIRQREAIVGVVGIGYVGASVAEGSSQTGYNTIGFDVDVQRVAAANAKKQVNFRATNDMSLLAKCDVICICVPTPLLPDRTPDYRFLTLAAQSVAQNMRPGQLIVVESSVAPGTTRRLVLPILNQSKYSVGTDFFLGYSPERIDPGNTAYGINNIPKLVSGLDELSSELTRQFYSSFVKTIVPVSSMEAAEMTKVLENLFRLVNISLVNELAEYTYTIGINMWEVIGAAATKPFGFLAHYPGPGAGGYCIPVLPRFLLQDAQRQEISLPLVQTALQVNEKRPQKIMQKALRLLNGIAQTKRPKILLVGITYKSDNHDTRESTALRVWEEATKLGADISYHDPYVPSYNNQASVPLTDKTVANHDIVIITTAHTNIQYNVLINADKPILDTRNVLKKYTHVHIHRV